MDNFPVPLPDDPDETVARLWDELADFGAARVDEALDHLLAALCELVAAQNAMWFGAVRLADIMPGDPIHGWRPHTIRHLHPSRPRETVAKEQVKNLDQGSVDITTIRNVALAGTFRANRLIDLVPESWFDSEYYQLCYRDVGYEDAIWAGFPINQDVEVYFGVLRDVGHPRFSAAERDTVAYALRGIKWFHRQLMLGHGLLVASIPLSPAERKVLQLLLTEASEKEIAEQLGLAVSTTHQYVTSIFRKYGVNGRAGLMSLWLNRAG